MFERKVFEFSKFTLRLIWLHTPLDYRFGMNHRPNHRWNSWWSRLLAVVPLLPHKNILPKLCTEISSFFRFFRSIHCTPLTESHLFPILFRFKRNYRFAQNEALDILINLLFSINRSQLPMNARILDICHMVVMKSQEMKNSETIPKKQFP